jgi:hypothetical protein
MIKILSVKTRREGSTREAFRRHYEERHVPLGLGFLEHFRWRRYVRNHVLAVHAGRVDFDCLTEFWVASRADQEATRAFALEPAFRVLDEDDARFLEIGRRFSCELAEDFVAGGHGAGDPPGTRRLMALFARPASSDPARFVATIAAAVRGGAWPGIAGCERIAIDGRVGEGPRPGDFAVLVSVWAAPGAALPPFDWQGELPPVAVVELDVVETPPSALFGSA